MKKSDYNNKRTCGYSDDLRKSVHTCSEEQVEEKVLQSKKLRVTKGQIDILVMMV